MSSEIDKLINPFNHNVEESLSNNIPNLSSFWLCYVVCENGEPKALSSIFTANIWPEFWPYVTKRATEILLRHLKKVVIEDPNFRTCDNEYWLIKMAKEISLFIRWDCEFFRNFPWNWSGLGKKTLSEMLDDEGFKRLDFWFKEPKYKISVSPVMQQLINKCMSAMYLKDDKEFTSIELERIDEKGLSDSDRFALRSLKLRYHALRDKQSSKSQILEIIDNSMKWIRRNGGKIYPDDTMFQFRMSCDDDKTTQWQALMRQKGFIGELIFVEDFNKLVREIPQNLIYKDGLKTLPDDLKFEYTPESQKKSIGEILKEVQEEYPADIKYPTLVPMYYPDFFAFYENGNIYTLTLFENTFSSLTSVKTKKDQEKWKKFVEEFNEINKCNERNELVYLEPIIQINIITINVKEYMTQVHGNKFIQTRINTVNELIQHYNQFKLSHENTSIMDTIKACKQLVMPNKVPIEYHVDQQVIVDLKEKINSEIKKDFDVENYIDLLEKPISENEAKAFEEDLIRLLKEKVIDNDLFKDQTKWTETDAEKILNGIKSIENNLFDKTRIMRMVENNHHDQTQFCTLQEGPDLSLTMQSIFDVFADLLSLLNEPKLTKLKPILCMMIHCSAGHKTYVTNTMQFGLCEGLPHKNSRINQLMKIILSSKIRDTRIAALKTYHDTGKPTPLTWSFGSYNIGHYKTEIEPYLQILIKKKEDADFNYRFTTNEVCNIVNSSNYELVKKPCCSSQIFRFEHSMNDIWVTCPQHSTRYKIIDPFSQLVEYLETIEKNNFSYNEVIEMLFNFAKVPGKNIFLISHITHFLSGCVSEKKLIKFVVPLYSLCHEFYKTEILKTLSKRLLKPESICNLNKLGLRVVPGKVTNDRMSVDSNAIANKWYLNNIEYLRDGMSGTNLTAEIKAVSSTNPFSFCLAEFAELMIKSRSQYFCLKNSVGYVTFSRTFGPIYSSPSSSDSESIKCFSSGDGHFFINHRTLRMMQSLPLLLISNKLIVDQMSNREFKAGNYSQDALVQFCLLNSRRLNVNLQNVRYFFMCCWSKFHSPELFKKLEMDFLKVSELNVSRAIIKFMRKVLGNYVHLNNKKQERLDKNEKSLEDPDFRPKMNLEKFKTEGIQPSPNFNVLFNKTVVADLNHVDLCLHSFYMVHLFEKTIPGKVQEIRKVFKKFLKPKLKWFQDLNKFRNDTIDEMTKARFLMSEGLNDDLSQCLDLVIDDAMKHSNKYSGFHLKFLKVAAMRFDSFNQNKFEAEMRIPNPVTDLLKSTSTVKKFLPNVDFQNLCDSVNLKKDVEIAMKQLDSDLVNKLLEKIRKEDEKMTLFPNCIKKMDNLKHTVASDIADSDKDILISLLDKFSMREFDENLISQIDVNLSKSSFMNICENYNEECFKTKFDKQKQEEITTEFFTRFPNLNTVVHQNPEFCLLLFMDNLKFDKDTIKEAWGKTRDKTKPIVSTDIDLAWAMSSCQVFDNDMDDIIRKSLSCIHKDRTPRNRVEKRQVQGIVRKFANPREMTTRLINEILNLMNKKVFADTYSVCHNFKFNDDPIVFGMAFKEQFGGERELTIADIWGKLTIKLQEDICRNIGKCMSNSCLNEPANESAFKDLIVKNQSSNQIYLSLETAGHSSSPIFGSIDRSKWGPFHQGLAFYAVLYTLINKTRGETDDIIDLVRYSSFKHALKKFEIHHNVAFSIILKGMKKGMIDRENDKWTITGDDMRPDIEMEEWELFTLKELAEGRKFIHTRMDMGQGMLHSSSDVYGAVIDNFIKQLTRRIISDLFNGKMNLTFESMNTSDDRSSLMRLSGTKRSSKEYDDLFKLCIFLEDILQRLGNMYISEKSVWSYVINEFKSAFMKNGVEIRVLVKFLSSQLTIGKDCFPEDFWNTYNSLTKQLLNNGGSQMMCDLIYLSKLHQLQTLYTFSKSPFKDCVLEAPPSRFGFPNLSCVDIYYHTSKHIMANRAVKFLHKCGIQSGVLTTSKIGKPRPNASEPRENEDSDGSKTEDRSADKVDDDEKGKKEDGEEVEEKTGQKGGEGKRSKDYEMIISKKQFRITDDKELPLQIDTHNGTKFRTMKSSEESKFKTEVKMAGSERSFFLHHKDALTCLTLRNSLVKFFTLAKTPGFMDSETICGGINTVLPSQRGKKTDKDIIDYRGLRDLDYLDYFIMVNKQNTQECAKIRSNQALYQSVKQEAKKSHQNMVFAKGLLINKGKFCYYGDEMVTQEYAMNNFNCDDEEFKNISNLIFKLDGSYSQINKALKNNYANDSVCETTVQNSVSNHIALPIDLHMSPEIRMTHSAFLVRAYIRSKTKETNLKDDYILANSNIVPITIDCDVIKFQKFYQDFSDVELMMLDMGKDKTTLAGVYMFEQSTVPAHQIGLILQGCIHNNVSRIIDVSSIKVKDKELDIENIYKAFVMISIWGTQDITREEMRNKILELTTTQPEIGSALVNAITDPSLGKICATLILFSQGENEGAQKVLLEQFKDFRSLSESGTKTKRTISGNCLGVSFIMFVDQSDQMNIQLTVSKCDNRAILQVQKRLRSAFGFLNENFIVKIDNDLPSDSNDRNTLDRKLYIQYSNSKFVIIMSDSAFSANVNYFDETDSEVEIINKWNNCVELTTNVPTISDVSVLWRLIKNDSTFEEIVRNIDYSCLSTDVYREQFNAMRKRLERLPSSHTNTRLLATLHGQNTNQVVMRDLIYDNLKLFKSLCPEFLTARSNPFTQILFVCKLISNCSNLTEVFSVKNISEALSSIKHKIPDIPILKFHGHQITNIAVINDDTFSMNPCSEFNTKNESFTLKPDKLVDMFGPTIGEHTILIFHKEVSVESLFAFQSGKKGVHVQVVDIDTEDFIVSSLRNVGNNCTTINDEVARRENWRIALMIEGSEVPAKRLSLHM